MAGSAPIGKHQLLLAEVDIAYEIAIYNQTFTDAYKILATTHKLLLNQELDSSKLHRHHTRLAPLEHERRIVAIGRDENNFVCRCTQQVDTR